MIHRFSDIFFVINTFVRDELVYKHQLMCSSSNQTKNSINSKKNIAFRSSLDRFFFISFQTLKIFSNDDFIDVDFVFFV